MTDSTPFVRRLYPPSSPSKSEGDVDVIAVKRAVSRMGLWPWRTFDDEYNERFSQAIAELHRAHGLRPSQVFTEKTHEIIDKAKAVHPHAGEAAYDAVAASLLRQAFARLVKSPEQAIAERLMDYCALFDGPYVWGGEHDGTFTDDDPHDGYDCSSSSSTVLHKFGIYPWSVPVVSGIFKSYGNPGRGRFVTVHAADDHVWIEFTIPGRRWARFDTSPHGCGTRGPRLRFCMRSADRFVARHWPGY